MFSSLTAFIPSLLATKLSVFDGNGGIGLEKQGNFSLLLVEENGGVWLPRKLLLELTAQSQWKTSRCERSQKPFSAHVKYVRVPRRCPACSILLFADVFNLGDGGMHLYFHCCSKVLFVLEVVGGGGREVT